MQNAIGHQEAGSNSDQDFIYLPREQGLRGWRDAPESQQNASKRGRQKGNYEDMFNYLLCEEIIKKDGYSKTMTFRINRISSFSRSKESGEVSSKAKENLERMLHLSPQYAFNEDKLICVRMNSSGKDLFRKIYHHRPSPVEVSKEGDWFRFCFNCSIAQASLYFRKFEQDTIEIVEPMELKEDLSRFFQKAVVPLNLHIPDDAEEK